LSTASIEYVGRFCTGLFWPGFRAGFEAGWGPGLFCTSELYCGSSSEAMTVVG
jgi:hypothetical protein